MSRSANTAIHESGDRGKIPRARLPRDGASEPSLSGSASGFPPCERRYLIMRPGAACEMLLGRASFLTALLIGCAFDSPPAFAVTGPPGFVVENAFPGYVFQLPTQVVFLPDDRKLVVEQGGVVWTMTSSGARIPTPFIDLSTKVLNNPSSGRGLLGLALDPDFSVNRWVYFAYTVDPDSNGIDDNDEAYSRIERYRVDATNPDLIDLSTRQVLIGPDWPTGIPCR